MWQRTQKVWNWIPLTYPLDRVEPVGCGFFGSGAGSAEPAVSLPTESITQAQHAKGSSKLNSARQLRKDLGRKLLICVGDAENDISMLDGADYAFCPSDGVIANCNTNVSPCADGTVADVIYKKIPEILANQP